MAFTYTDPANSVLEEVRFLIGDTDSTNALLQDAEISYAISKEMTPYGAAARCAEALSVKFGKVASRKLGPLSVDATNQASFFRGMASELRARDVGSGTPYVGGVSEAEHDAEEDSTDLRQKVFSRGMMDNELEE